MRVLLVDDHALFLEGLKSLLTARGVEVAGTASDGLEALEKARALHPDVIFMDIQMPRCDGLMATRLIKAELPGIDIVMLTVASDDESLFEAVRIGASGYLLKGLDAKEFFALLDELERGDAPLSPGLAGRILREFSHLARDNDGEAGLQARPDSPGSGLNARQMEILTLVAQGQPYREIAAALCLSERTVKYHVKEILGRLHLENRSQAIAYAARMGLARGKGKGEEEEEVKEEPEPGAGGEGT